MKLGKIFSICIFLLLALTAQGQEKVDPIEGMSYQKYTESETNGLTSIDPSEKQVKPKRKVTFSTYIQMILMLIFVIFLIFVFFYLTKGRLKKKFVGNNGIEVLCRASLMPKQSILVVRIGTRILILNASSDGHVSTLSEIIDPKEIADLLTEVNQASRDNLFDSLLKRNQVLYDEEAKKQDKTLDKIDRQTDDLQASLERDKRV